MAETVFSTALEELLRNAATPEEAVRVCAQAGIPITAEQLEEALRQHQASESGELSEETLDAVAGGINWWDILRRLPLPFGPIHPWRR